MKLAVFKETLNCIHNPLFWLSCSSAGGRQLYGMLYDQMRMDLEFSYVVHLQGMTHINLNYLSFKYNVMFHTDYVLNSC
jgi:hypothetical protein